MRYSPPNPTEPGPPAANPQTTEDLLRQEIEDLKKQLAAKNTAHVDLHSAKPPHPSRGALWLLMVVIVVVIVAGFLAGFIPRERRESVIASETKAEQETLPVVSVVTAANSASVSALVLPGNVQAVTEAPVLARADGYIKRRLVDIGDRVAAGQLLAELEAPELDQQVRQAQASLAQAKSSQEQASANLDQGRGAAALAEITAKRWSNLALKGVVSRQENDTYQSQYQSSKDNVRALEKAVAAARSNVSAVEANLARLEEMQGYKMVKAPFSGVITVRNVDTGALVTATNTLLFRIAQTGMLRIYVNVPQANAESVHVGQAAQIRIADLANTTFNGTVTRTASSFDPASRTLLTEVQLANSNGALMPGMYAQVDLSTNRKDPPIVLPSGTLVVRADGPQVAVLRPDNTVHFQRIQIGRDYGDRIEVASGLEHGDSVIVNPSDAVREGIKVNPIQIAAKPTPAAAK